MALRIPANQNASTADDLINCMTAEESALGYATFPPAAPQPGAFNGHSHNHVDADMYSSADGVDGNPTLATSSGSQPQVVDVYSFVSKPKPPTKPEPKKDEYAVVGSRSRPKSEEDVAYAQVNKGTKRGNSNPSRPSQPEAEGETYAQVRKLKPAAKPAPATKPKPVTAAGPAVPGKRGLEGKKKKKCSKT